MNFNNITFLTATFNVHTFTLNMLKSLYALLGNKLPQIKILDNSTSNFFPIIRNDFIDVIDNTNFKHTKNYNQPSKNHCSSIEYAFSLIKTKYVLLFDNDIIFKQNFIDFFNSYEDYNIIGEIGYDIIEPNRLFPYLCLIDLEFCKKNNIHYFDNSRCMENGIMDTGCSFLLDCQSKNAIINNVHINDFIIHLKGGTLRNKSIKDFIAANQNYLK